MQNTGIRSNTRVTVALTVLLLLFSSVRPVRALDVFTLWRQAEVPIRFVEGEWADYRFQVMSGGKSDQNLTRVACLERRDGTDNEAWLVEVLPLREKPDGSLVPVPGEGVRLRLSRRLLERRGSLLDAVLSARQWTGGRATDLSAADLRQDPLLADSLKDEFEVSSVVPADSTTRVVGGIQFMCAQFVMTAADTQSAKLPAGTLVQLTSRELAVAVHPGLPFLGLAYVSERIRAESHLEPPGGRFRPPAPRVRVEVMELLAFGSSARPNLGVGD